MTLVPSFAAPPAKAQKALSAKIPVTPERSSDTAANLKLGGHLFRHYCAVCHGVGGAGNGVNADNLDPHPADLTGEEVAGLSDQEIYDVIEKGGAGVELSANMPPWGKTLSKAQINVLVAYIRTLSKSEEAPEPVRLTDIRTGEKSDCNICHMPTGAGRQIAPNLGHEGSKLHAAWLSSFLKNPDRIRPIGFIPLTKTKMPNFYFSDEEVFALTAFLMTQKDAGVSTLPGGSDFSDEAEIERGRALFEDQFACSACHRMGGDSGGQVGPDLVSVSERLQPAWVFAWLKNPQAIRPDVPMPNFGMTDQEARSLVSYLVSLGKKATMPVVTQAPDAWVKRGEKLVKDKNCLACHILDAYDSRSRNGGMP